MTADRPTPLRRTIGLRLTVSFLAFLAVVPLLIYLAGRTALDEKDRARDREWLLRRTNASIAIATKFDALYREAQLKEAGGGGSGTDGVADADMRKALASGFQAQALQMELRDGSLFWDEARVEMPSPVLLASVGTAETIADGEMQAALRLKEPIVSNYPPSAGIPGPHDVQWVKVTLPLERGDRPRVVARLRIPLADAQPRGLSHAVELGRWVAVEREKLARVAFLKRFGATPEDRKSALGRPLKNWDALQAAILAAGDELCRAYDLPGFVIYRAVDQAPAEGATHGERVLGPWVRHVMSAREGSSETAAEREGREALVPRSSSTSDQEAFKNGKIPGAESSAAHVSIPLIGPFVPPNSIEPESGVVAVAHLELPPPPRGGGTASGFLIFTIAIMALVLGFLFFYVQQAVSQPIQRLIGAMTSATGGDLQPIAQGQGTGEVGQLAMIYNRMVHENRNLLDQIRAFNEDLKTKVRLATGELERRNEELRRANDKLFGLQRELSEQQRLASLGQLAGSMAHELGTPLNAMSGHVELMLGDEKGLPADVGKRLRLIGNQIERLSVIIQRTLHQLRAPAPRFASINLNSLVQGIVSLVTPSVATRKVGMRTSLAPGLPPVSGDAGQIEQVLMNLVNNALDAMPNGGSLDLLTAMEGGKVCLQVRDTGAGVSAEDRDRIFDPFFTTKLPGQGTGLGLAICREIVKAHNGTIELQSEPGNGSWFTVRLPSLQANN